MCEFCEGQDRERRKREEQLRQEISLLGKGELPADTEYPLDCRNESERERLRMEILIARAALLISSLQQCSPTMVLGELAGTMFQVEAEAVFAAEVVRQQKSRDAFLN
jgi:hypothetical protein